MRFRTTHAKCQTGDAAKNAREAVRAIKGDLDGFPASAVVFHAATDYDPDVLAAEMHDAFPGAVTFGCTTAGEGVDGLVLNASVVAMAFSHDAFAAAEYALVVDDCAAPEGEGVFTDAREAMGHFGRSLGEDCIRLDYRSHVGVMLGDRISPFTERVLETVGELTDVIFVGGFAGDDYTFTGRQYVFYRGRAYKDAAVLCLWKPANGFRLLKTQAVEPTGSQLVITRADEANRIIWEFDNEDAVAAYARAIDTPAESMDILDFDEHPLAVTADGEPFLRAVVKQVDGRGLQMFAQIKEGTRQTVTRAGDVYAVTERELRQALDAMGGASAILHINCASRHTALRNAETLERFAALFGAAPSISFASYGEIYVGVVALTSTMILFK